MSYASFVNAAVDERLRTEFGTTDRKYAALKFASDNFGDYPERRVYEVLLEKGWPGRPVTVGEVGRALRRVPSTEQLVWLDDRRGAVA